MSANPAVIEYALDGGDYLPSDDWTPWDSDEHIVFLIENDLVPLDGVEGVQEVMKGRT